MKIKKMNSVIKTGDTLKLLDEVLDNTVKLIITSPPYNIGKEYEKKKRLSEYLKNQKEVITKCCGSNMMKCGAANTLCKRFVWT